MKQASSNPHISRESILVVDDAPISLAVLSGLLERQGYRVRTATSGAAALRRAACGNPPDLVLLDVMMPAMDGYEVLERLRARASTAHIPVMMVTARDALVDEERALTAGAADYITKPFAEARVLARVRSQLDSARAQHLLREQNAELTSEVARGIAASELMQTVSIRALAHLAETRDPETGNHIQRTQAYVQLLASEMKSRSKHASLLTESYIALLVRSAPLHDIGKVGIPDRILLKPGKLDPCEWSIMQTHTVLGARAIELAELDAAAEVDFLTLAKEIAHWHHERWDGTGYPDGLAGEAIPLSARLMALADVFDALVSPRVYKRPMSCAQAREIILAGGGSHFDPDVVAAFDRRFDAFASVAAHYADIDANALAA